MGRGGRDGRRRHRGPADRAERFGGLDICVANAGVGRIEDFVAGSRDSWMYVLDVNIIGVMLTLRAVAERMIDGGRGGRLLATASIAGLRGEPHAPSTAYAASRAAVMGLMRAISVEVAAHDITANAVAPGQIDSGIARGNAVAGGKAPGRTPCSSHTT